MTPQSINIKVSLEDAKKVENDKNFFFKVKICIIIFNTNNNIIINNIIMYYNFQ